MRLLIKITLVCFCGTLGVASCTLIPPTHKPPASVPEILNTTLPSTPAVTQSTLAQSLITELPNSQPQPLKQVNQAGQVPTTTTLTEQTLDMGNLKVAEGEEIQLDFEQTDLRQILEIIADKKDQIFELAVEAGADDVTFDGDEVEIISPVDSFKSISERLRAAGITPDEAGLRMSPSNEIELGDDETIQILRLVEGLEELDDVQNVFHNLKVSDEIWTQLEEA